MRPPSSTLPTPPPQPPWYSAWPKPPASAISEPPAAPTQSCTAPQSSSRSAVPSSCGLPTTTTSPSSGQGSPFTKRLKQQTSSTLTESKPASSTATPSSP